MSLQKQQLVFSTLKPVTNISIFKKSALDFILCVMSSVSFVSWVCGGRYWPVLYSVSFPDYLSLLTSLGSYSNTKPPII